MSLTGNVSQATLDVLKQMPDSLLQYNFDIFSVSAEAAIARIIGAQTVTHPQFLALRNLEATLNPTHAAANAKFGIDIPTHKLRLVFNDLNFDQAQLNARTAFMQSELSQLVIRQFDSKGDVVRYLVFNDLTPETVKFNLDGNASSGDVAERACTWLFKTLQETKEFPGAL